MNIRNCGAEVRPPLAGDCTYHNSWCINDWEHHHVITCPIVDINGLTVVYRFLALLIKWWCSGGIRTRTLQITGRHLSTHGHPSGPLWFYIHNLQFLWSFYSLLFDAWVCRIFDLFGIFIEQGGKVHLGNIQKLRWQDEVGRWFFKCQHYLIRLFSEHVN